MSTTDLALRARQLYRALLRELPRRHLSLSAPLPSSSSSSTSSDPIKRRFRTQFEQSSSLASIQQCEQFVQYAKAQRMYATLLARYNPGMDMDQEERVRLTARRVGMDLPIENGAANAASADNEKWIIESTENGPRLGDEDKDKDNGGRG